MKLRNLKFKDLSLENLFTLPVSELLENLPTLKSLHFAIKSRSSGLLAVCSNVDVLYHLVNGNLSDTVETILSLDVEDENYLVYYQEEDESVLEACKKFAGKLHRAVVESRSGLKIATQVDILKKVQDDEDLQVSIKEFFKGDSRLAVDLKYVNVGTTLRNALEEMKNCRLPCLPVLDNGKLIGSLCPLVVSRLDPKSFKQQLDSPVDDLVIGLASDTVTESDSISKVISLMIKSGDSRVFLTKDDKVCGVVSASDILKVLVSFE